MAFAAAKGGGLRDRMEIENKTADAANGRRWVGQFDRLPDTSGARIAEGGRRLNAKSPARQSSEPLVSIVTVAFNAGATIEQTIRSVLDQRYSNIEYIIIDGASTDGTLDVIRKYEDEIDYFISEPDDGVYAAMNKGLAAASGEYLCILNADDRLHAHFVASQVSAARDGDPDIVCGAIEMNGSRIAPRAISAGVYFGHLNFFHGTFLVKRACYDDIGPYDERYRVASDALWVQNAFEKQKTFSIRADAIVYFAEGGLSSGNTPERREALIAEMAAIYRRRFPFVTEEDARLIYILRFNKKHLSEIERIARRYASRSKEFAAALAGYVRHCLSERPAFVFNRDDLKEYFPGCIRVLSALDIDLSDIQFDLPDHDIAGLIAQIDALAAGAEKAKQHGKLVLLHFAEVFSRPSETFIYDLLLRLSDAGWAHNVLLCDERRLSDERPLANCLELPWQTLPEALRGTLYRRFFSKVGADALICHFAASGRWLYHRLKPMGIRRPTIHMTHGIDVFAIGTNPEYRAFIRRYAVIDPQTEFTAVSEYLASELVAQGAPAEKITVLPNVVHPRFFAHRKSGDFFDGDRELRLLNIGRLIELKGHRFLLEGLRYFVDRVSKDVVLTIVYGGDETNLPALKEQIAALGLEGHVRLLGFVNFEKEPAFFADFDLFVMSSTYSNDQWKRSESFGIATLEAIASGLPVIVTDAGGSHEIVGGENDFAKIVPHGSGQAIGEAIAEFYQERKGFRDNKEYAERRLQYFQPERQIEHLRELIDKVRARRLNVAVFSAIASGGAGGAALRVHESLLRSGVRSRFITRSGQPVDRQTPFVELLEPDLAGSWDLLQTTANQRPGHTMFTVNEPRLDQETIAALVEDAEVINVQWVARQLSVENMAFLSNLGKPLVITVRDMQPLTGGCHFFHGCERWKHDCFACPQLADDMRDIPHLTQKYKLAHWNRDNITVVALSRHSANIIAQSPLFKGCPVEIIANPIDLDIFAPVAQHEARAALGLPPDGPLAFYAPSFNSLVKGHNELNRALSILREKRPDLGLRIVIAGAAAEDGGELPYEAISLGRIQRKKKLARAYAAADITLVPSLEETFSNTAAESAACGTPVVGFETGAIPEIGKSGVRGGTAPAGDCEALADAIAAALSGPSMRRACRDYALANFSFEGQGQRYRDLFERLANEYRERRAPEAPNGAAFPLFQPGSCEVLFERQAKALDFKRRVAIDKALEQGAAERERALTPLRERLLKIRELADLFRPTGDETQNIAAPQTPRGPVRLMAMRFANLWAWARHIASVKRLPTILFFVLITAALTCAFVVAPFAPYRLYLLASALALASAGAAYVVLSYVKNKIRTLHDQSEGFRRRILHESVLPEQNAESAEAEERQSPQALR